MRGLSWANFVLGLWLIVAPFVLRFSADSSAMWDSVVVGIVVAILAIIRAFEQTNIQSLQHQHHGAH